MSKLKILKDHNEIQRCHKYEGLNYLKKYF